jgi:hypothetical protein
VQAFTTRRIEREVAEAHALHTPAHDESSSDAHQDILSQPSRHLILSAH